MCATRCIRHAGTQLIEYMERDFVIWWELDAVFLGRLVKGSYSTSPEGLVMVRTSSGSMAGEPPSWVVIAVAHAAS